MAFSTRRAVLGPTARPPHTLRPERRCAGGPAPAMLALLPVDGAPGVATDDAMATDASSSTTTLMWQRRQLQDELQLLAGPPST